MRVICVTNIFSKISKGKVYDIIESWNDGFLIKCDDGIHRWYNLEAFITFDDYRDIKLDKLLKNV